MSALDVAKSVGIGFSFEELTSGEEGGGMDLLGMGGDRLTTLVGRLVVAVDEISAEWRTPFSVGWSSQVPSATLLEEWARFLRLPIVMILADEGVVSFRSFPFVVSLSTSIKSPFSWRLLLP